MFVNLNGHLLVYLKIGYVHGLGMDPSFEGPEVYKWGYPL